MADVFLSYSSTDRERARPIRNALVVRGLSVFWDQDVPTGVEWDASIRQNLNDAQCAVVLWSRTSITSAPVCHEARMALQQQKLIPILLDALSVDQLPLGMDAFQAAQLHGWNGDTTSTEWLAIVDRIERLVTPAWLQRRLDDLVAAVEGERSQRAASERREAAVREQLARETEAGRRLSADLERASAESAGHRKRIEEAEKEREALVASNNRLSADLLGLRAKLRGPAGLPLWGFSRIEAAVLCGALGAVAWGLGSALMQGLAGCPADPYYQPLGLAGLIGGIANAFTLKLADRSFGVVRLLAVIAGWSIALSIGGEAINSSVYSDPWLSADRCVNLDAVLLAGLSAGGIGGAILALVLRWTYRFRGWSAVGVISMVAAIGVGLMPAAFNALVAPNGSMKLAIAAVALAGAAIQVVIVLVLYRAPARLKAASDEAVSA